jgi:hypothetical protein
MAIFHHVDQDGDSVEILAYEGGDPLALLARNFGGRRVEVDICREAAIRLHNALGEWLYPTGVPVPDDRQFTPADIRAMVAGQVAEIMALHQAPQAKYVDAGPGWSSHSTIGHEEPDPEPHDVGHPDPAKEPLPVRNPLENFAQLLEGTRAALAHMYGGEPAEVTGGHPQPTWDDELFAPEVAGEWTRCPCPQTGIKGIQCPRCGHIHHTAAIGCTARVRRVQS